MHKMAHNGFSTAPEGKPWKTSHETGAQTEDAGPNGAHGAQRFFECAPRQTLKNKPQASQMAHMAHFSTNSHSLVTGPVVCGGGLGALAVGREQHLTTNVNCVLASILRHDPDGEPSPAIR